MESHNYIDLEVARVHVCILCQTTLLIGPNQKLIRYCRKELRSLDEMMLIIGDLHSIEWVFDEETT